MGDAGSEEEEGGYEEPTAPAWMATFGDLMSLLLTFFILLLSFSSMDQKKLSDVAGSVRDAFGIQFIHPGSIEALSNNLISLSDHEESPYLRVIDMPSRYPEKRQRLLRRLKMSAAGQQLERLVEVEESPRGVIVRVPGAMLFDSGGTDLRPESLVYLREIALLIRKIPGDVSIEGHTDASGGGSSLRNWRISSARAVSALEYLVKVGHIDPRRLRASAFADTRPVAPNDTAEHRRENRRVEFVFLKAVEEEAPPKDSASRDSQDARAAGTPVRASAVTRRKELPTSISR